MIGEGLSRTDGPLKVTGRALYSAERREMGEPLHGFILGAAIGQGRVASIDTSRAEAMAGVRLVWTHRNAPPQAAIIPKSDILDVQPQLTTDTIAHYGAPVAFVVADTFEQARAAAAAIDVLYDAAPGAFVLDEASAAPEWHDESRVGDLDAAMASSDATVDAVYATPYHFSQPMELHACIADWRNGHLTLHIASQMVAQLADAVADTILIGRDCVTVDSRFVGGGFGAKIALHAEAILSALATRQLNRPVQLVLTRRQGFTVVGHRPASISRVRLAASRDGRLTGIGHDANIQVSPEGNWKEGVATVARALYAAPHRLTRTRHSTLDTGVCEPVRGPGEVPGLMVFESAMDELAEKLGIDPLELRIR
ncbi:MAG: xanthine dehydrogenase family protein molybdopterin-binding subunit, partial [Devosia sp.]